jgi:hypothetical protein
VTVSVLSGGRRRSQRSNYQEGNGDDTRKVPKERRRLELGKHG